MTAISKLADFVSGATFATLSHETIEHVKMHVLDTIGAMLVGSETPEGVGIGKLLGKLAVQSGIPVVGYPFRAALLPAIIAGCAAARCTEIDDIHLESCTTPGSVIVPTALSLASACYFVGPMDFLLAVALGYEVLIRLGMAINGPEALYRGLWPTCLGAGLGSATVAARALELSSRQTAGCIATAVTMSSGIADRNMSAVSSRWLTLGLAAQNGVAAAFSAKEGFMGDDALLDKTAGRIYGLRVSQGKLVGGLGQRFLVDQTGMKPYAIARQALSAVEAFREIVATNQVNPESIQEVSVWVPRQFVSIVDHPRLPENRRESVLSVQYQIALAAFDPTSLYDVKREQLVKDARIAALVEKIHVKPSEELELCYPSAWPAMVEIKADRQAYSYKMLHPKGDPHNRFSWDDVTSKFKRVAKRALGETAAEQVAQLVRKLDANSSLAHLLDLLT